MQIFACQAFIVIFEVLKHLLKHEWLLVGLFSRESGTY